MEIDKSITDTLRNIATSAKEQKVTDWKLGAPRKIIDQLGSWYILVLNIREQRRFNGLPDEDSKIIVLDANVTANAENKVDGYEMVFEVLYAPKSDLILAAGQNNFVEVPPIVNVGDIVLAKGHVNKIHTEPVVYTARRENFVALIKKAEDREDYVK